MTLDPRPWCDFSRPLVLSFFDYTGHAVRDWCANGAHAWCFDRQHPEEPRTERVDPGRGLIVYFRADLSAGSPDWMRIRDALMGRPVAMAFGFPPCTDLAGSGALHWKAKAVADPGFQDRAAAMARGLEAFMAGVAGPWVVENPSGALSRLWRRPDHRFDPCDFGGYLPAGDQHPRWPKYIAPRDAYTKATFLWAGGGFRMPERRPVAPEVLERRTRSGRILRGSRQFMLLGGNTLKTKNIRNETPRGFARAVFLAHRYPTP